MTPALFFIQPESEKLITWIQKLHEWLLSNQHENQPHEVHKVFDRVLSEFNPVCLRVFQHGTVLLQELSRLATATVA